MCTATWIVRPDGFDLLFNRDERRERAAADPPRIVTNGTVRALAPRDGEQGGTWIGVNELGLALALLNRYDGDPAAIPRRADDETVSRGAIVTRMLAARSADAALRRLREDDLGLFRPFDLLALAPGDHPWRASWDGARLEVSSLGDADRPLVSTSIAGGDVTDARRAAYGRIAGPAPDVGRLLAFHACHWPERGPRSPCMHRDEAATVSASRITVGPRRVRFRYAAGPPCRTPFDGDGLSLERPQADRAQSR